jgi:hypothetical protein
MGRIQNILEADIKITVDMDGEDVIETVKDVKMLPDNSKGWKVAQKGNQYYISKDGRIYMEVDKKLAEAQDKNMGRLTDLIEAKLSKSEISVMGLKPYMNKIHFEMIDGSGIRMVMAFLSLEKKGYLKVTHDKTSSNQIIDGRGNSFGNTRGSYRTTSRIIRAEFTDKGIEYRHKELGK